ncbi:hypothetical protein T492DRAFT_998131, partial [Pavlovales sp. CCMP2436]
MLELAVSCVCTWICVFKLQVGGGIMLELAVRVNQFCMSSGNNLVLALVFVSRLYKGGGSGVSCVCTWICDLKGRIGGRGIREDSGKGGIGVRACARETCL